MRRFSPLLTCLLLGLTLVTSACGATPAATSAPSTASTPNVAAQASPTPDSPSSTMAPTPTTLPATPTLTPNVRPQYNLDASMNYDARSLDVTEQVLYTNASSDSLPDLVLAVEPNLWDKAFTLQTASVNDQPLDNYTLDGQKLDIPLSPSLAGGQTLKLALAWHLDIPQAVQGDPNVIRPQIFGYSQRQVNLVDWYPFIVPYVSGTGWVLHKPWFYGENLVYPLADFDITLRFSDPSNEPVIAASGPVEQNSDGSLHYVQARARDFVFSMSHQYKTLSSQQDGATITSYYFTPYTKASQATLDTAMKAVKTYSDLFGPYPHKTLAVVQGDFNDGMEFDGLVFLSNDFYNLYDGTERNYLVMVTAHETAHQWWFGRVADDQAETPWLDEALATYTERIFYEKNYPNSVAWWWATRVDFYKPSGYVDIPIYDGGGFRPYTNAVYFEGAHFLEDLRQRIGDPAFFAFLKDYSTQMDGKIATPADFFRILRAHTTTDFSDLLTKYFKNSY